MKKYLIVGLVFVGLAGSAPKQSAMAELQGRVAVLETEVKNAHDAFDLVEGQMQEVVEHIKALESDHRVKAAR